MKLWIGFAVTILTGVGVVGFHCGYQIFWHNMDKVPSVIRSHDAMITSTTPEVTTTPKAEKQRFPKADFVWGVATSAYQIEGAVYEDHRGPTIWDTFVHTTSGQQQHVLDESTGDVADDHYHRYQEDIQLMHHLNIRAYRFSIAWSRILPTGRGPINPSGLQFYDQLIDELLRHNIEPWITLFHWDLPQALQDDFNGWMDVRTVQCFVDYANIVFQHFSHKVKRFITINEPWT
jgi:beta-glucosidase/6-phospho-beta-glucosidase/beta-galactosidase